MANASKSFRALAGWCQPTKMEHEPLTTGAKIMMYVHFFFVSFF